MLRFLQNNSFLIAISKILGFVRDLIISYFFGTSISADIFNIASLFTNYPFILFGGLNGPFHTATNHVLAQESDPIKQKTIINRLMLYTTAALLLFGIILVICSIYIIQNLFGNYDLFSQQEIQYQIYLSLPCLIITGIMGVLYGANCFYHRYSISAINPAISSLNMIVIILMGHHIWGAYALGIGMSTGALVQCWSLYTSLQVAFRHIHSDISTVDDLDLDQPIQDYQRILYPALLSSTIGSINVYIDMIFCQGLIIGSWTAILLANRLIQLPFGILVAGILPSFLAEMTASWRANDFGQFRQQAASTIYNLLLLLIPLMVIFFFGSEYIVRIVFARGAFDEQSIQLATIVLMMLSCSLITSLPREILTRVFYAQGNSRLPFILSLISIMINALLDYILVHHYAAGGIALSTTLTALFNSLLFIYYAKQFIQWSWKRTMILILYIILCFISLYTISTYVFPHIATIDWRYDEYLSIDSIFRLLLLAVAGFLCYGLFARQYSFTNTQTNSSSKILSK